MRLDKIYTEDVEDLEFYKRKAEAYKTDYSVLAGQMTVVQGQLAQKIHGKIQDAIHIKLVNLKEWLAQSPDPMQIQDKTYAGIAINARSLVDRLEKVLSQVEGMRIGF